MNVFSTQSISIADAVTLTTDRLKTENASNCAPTAELEQARANYIEAAKKWPASMATAASILALTYVDGVDVAAVRTAIAALSVNT